MQTFVLAGGCFWCLDAVYRVLNGVTEVVAGYAGGTTEHPSYEAVCTGTTGHAEVVAVTFDPELIPADILLDVFFTLHDPTQLNRQGNDIGTQYRSAMFPADDTQRELFGAAIERAREWWAPAELVTTMEPLETFYSAEEYHQNFFAKNPGQGYCLAVAVPKVNKIRASYTKYLRAEQSPAANEAMYVSVMPLTEALEFATTRVNLRPLADLDGWFCTARGFAMFSTTHSRRVERAAGGAH